MPRPMQLTSPLLSLPCWFHYWGHTEIWQVSSTGMAEHCSAQATDILRKPSIRGGLRPLTSPSSTVLPPSLWCSWPMLHLVWLQHSSYHSVLSVFLYWVKKVENFLDDLRGDGWTGSLCYVTSSESGQFGLWQIQPAAPVMKLWSRGKRLFSWHSRITFNS